MQMSGQPLQMLFVQVYLFFFWGSLKIEKDYR